MPFEIIVSAKKKWQPGYLLKINNAKRIKKKIFRSEEVAILQVKTINSNKLLDNIISCQLMSDDLSLLEKYEQIFCKILVSPNKLIAVYPLSNETTTHIRKMIFYSAVKLSDLFKNLILPDKVKMIVDKDNYLLVNNLKNKMNLIEIDEK